MNSIKRLLILIILLVFGLVMAVSPLITAQAQSEMVFARILQLDSTNFPKISFIMAANQPDGTSFNSLDKSQVRIQEDSLQMKSVDALEPIDAGIQIIVAYNLGPALSKSNATSGTRFQAINDAIIAWAQAHKGFLKDDYSLAINTGLQAIRVQDQNEFAQVLQDLKPDLGNNQPNLTSLLQSLDLATDPNPDPLMKRVILYVTPQLNVTNISAIEGLIDRAERQGIKVFIWLVGPATVETSNPSVVDPLKEMTERTGGAFFLYSGEGDLPDPEDYLRPMRNLYRVSYQSKLNTIGNHQLVAAIRQGSIAVNSAPYSFPLTIQPPNMVILNPIFDIERVWESSANGAKELVLTPQEEQIEYLVEFPDGHQRPIIATRFYENGILISEDKAAPFDKFNWDFSKFDSTQSVELTFEVEDSLGLIQKSIPQVVKINVAEKPLTFWQSLITFQLSLQRWIILGSVLATGSVLVIALILAGKRRFFWQQQSAARERHTDPLTQPVPVRQEISRQSSAPPSTYPQINGQEVTAWLVPLNNLFEALRAKAIPLIRPELVIGHDSRQAGLVIPSAAISEVHARLTRDARGDFWLADNNSIAGTWVNYTPISTQAIRLRHGDLVHFAKNVYRFELSNPPADREVQLISYNDEI